MTLWDMIPWLHILITLMLVVPMGLLEHSANWLECGGSSFLLEDADGEDSESSSRVEVEKHWLSVDAVSLSVSGTLIVPVFPTLPQNSVQIECAELRGCRPPPNFAIR